MKSIFNKHILLHPLVLIAYAVFFASCVGSYVYYHAHGKPEALSFSESMLSLSDDITASGIISPAENPDLSFLSSGRVAKVTVAVGQHVSKGMVLAVLDTASLEASRAQAQASLKAAEATLSLQNANAQNTTVSIDQVKQQQDTLVANAHRNLLSDGLTAVPMVNEYTVNPPVVSGQYDGQEGTYKVVIRHGAQLGIDDHNILTFDLENTPSKPIAKNQATPLGTLGLYISFPGELSNYDDTVWYVTIPNTRSASYLSNQNAYQEALTVRTKAISDAQTSLNMTSDASSVSSAQIKSAQAAVEAAQANVAAANIAIGNATIIAPFDGTVSSVPVKIGDIVSSNVPAVSLSPDMPLHIDVFLSEFSVAKIHVGDQVDVTLDAYGDTRVLQASVASIDTSPTDQAGILAYKTSIQFTSVDPNIATGMTANVTIHPTHI